MIDGRVLTDSGALLFTDSVGKDACGIGGIASKDGAASAEVLQRALLALTSLEHRGGVCGNSGDGAGLTCQIPQLFLREEVKRLGLPGAKDLKATTPLGVGSIFFFDTDPAKLDSARKLIVRLLTGGPLQLLGFRPVPTQVDCLPPAAKNSRPQAIEQLLFRFTGEGAAVEKWLFRQRLTIQHELRTAGLDAYVSSLSVRLISYKGLLTSPQFVDFFPDLSHPEFHTGIATFHRRYSTNTFPNWKLAQPFRFTCHNGEINTIRTNRNAVSAFSRGLTPPLPGRELLTSKMSDSASLDEWLEYLTLVQDWSMLRALRLSIPPVWDTEEAIWGAEAFQLFTYCRRTYGSLCAWDGPAGIIGTEFPTRPSSPGSARLLKNAANR